MAYLASQTQRTASLCCSHQPCFCAQPAIVAQASVAATLYGAIGGAVVVGLILLLVILLRRLKKRTQDVKSMDRLLSSAMAALNSKTMSRDTPHSGEGGRVPPSSMRSFPSTPGSIIQFHKPQPRSRGPVSEDNPPFRLTAISLDPPSPSHNPPTHEIHQGQPGELVSTAPRSASGASSSNSRSFSQSNPSDAPDTGQRIPLYKSGLTAGHPASHEAPNSDNYHKFFSSMIEHAQGHHLTLGSTLDSAAAESSGSSTNSPTDSDSSRPAPVLLERQRVNRGLSRLGNSGGGFMDQYRLLGMLQRRQGCLSVVQFATDFQRKTKVALKFFLSTTAFDSEAANLLKEGVHRLAVPQHVTARNDSKGENLQEWFARVRPSHLELLATLQEIARLIQLLHSLGLVHRNLKPENIILIDHRHTWRLADFGCAKEAGMPVRLTVSVAYSPPESLTALYDGASTLRSEAAADIWALGVIAYDMLLQVAAAKHQALPPKGVPAGPLGLLPGRTNTAAAESALAPIRAPSPTLKPKLPSSAQNGPLRSFRFLRRSSCSTKETSGGVSGRSMSNSSKATSFYSAVDCDLSGSAPGPHVATPLDPPPQTLTPPVNKPALSDLASELSKARSVLFQESKSHGTGADTQESIEPGQQNAGEPPHPPPSPGGDITTFPSTWTHSDAMKAALGLQPYPWETAVGLFKEVPEMGAAAIVAEKCLSRLPSHRPSARQLSVELAKVSAMLSAQTPGDANACNHWWYNKPSQKKLLFDTV